MPFPFLSRKEVVKLFHEWEIKYGRKLIQDTLSQDQILTMDYTPPDATWILHLLDKWGIHPPQIIDWVDSGKVPVVVGWEIEESIPCRHRIDAKGNPNPFGHKTITPRLFVNNNDVQSMENRFPQLAEEAKKWEKCLSLWEEARGLCYNAQMQYRYGHRIRRNAYSYVNKKAVLMCREKKSNLELHTALAEKDARIAELERELAAAKATQPAATDEAAETGSVDSGRWAASTAAACRAIIEVCRSGRTDWVSGQNSAGSTDNSGDETFNALLSRMNEGRHPVLTQAERAAWGALSKAGFTWTGGRKPSK